MATIADLNVRIGASFADLEKGLRGAERALQRSGQRLSNLGSELSLAITAPLGALGVASIKAAGDIEALGLALESQLGSASAAADELERLRKSALLPGLGFEQAVRGSVSLQAVGLSADDARRTIEAFGNGLALAGKGGQELDGVILALTQISAKGVISAEEINQIAERLPQIRTLLKDAFGTADTEALQKLGVTSEQFISTITKELEKLPKATGGIKNAIENSGDAVKQFLATIGTEINKAFDLVGFSESLSAGLQDAAAAFASLDGETKKTIVQVALFAVALGPAVKLLGVIQLTAAGAIGGLQTVALAMRNAAGAALGAAKAFGALKAAQQATIIGAAVTVVVALAVAFDNLQDRTGAATESLNALRDVNDRANESIANNKAEVDRLVAVVKDQNSTYEQQQKALRTLAGIAPDYFGQLKESKNIVEDVTRAQKRYIDSLLLTAKIQAAKESLVEYERQLLKIAEASEPDIIQRVTNFVLAGGNAYIAAARDANTYGENIKDNVARIEAAKQSLGGLITQLEGEADATGKATEEKKKYTAAKTDKQTREETKAIEDQNRALREKIELQLKDLPTLAPSGNIASTVSASFNRDQTDLPELSIGGLVDGLSTLNEIAAAVPVTVTAAIAPAQALFDGLTNNVLTMGEAWQALGQIVTDSGSGIEQVAFAMGDAIARFAEQGGGSLAEFANVAVEAGKKVIAILIKEGVAAAITKALEGSAFAIANPLAAVALAGAAGIAASALFSGILGKIKIPALAEGGITTGPQLAMVGDNPGGREAIIPLNKLPGLLGQMNGNGYIAETRIQGTELILLLKRADVAYQRTVGKK